MSTAPARRRGGWRASTVIGLVLLMAGLSILGWAGWQYVGTNFTSERAAAQRKTQLTDAWTAAEPPRTADPAPAAGEPFALVRIPKLGSDWEWPVLVGTDLGDLAHGIGWYSDTARPGQIGNFALAGHRVTHGEPFRRLLELQKGDRVIVETASKVYTYELDSSPSELTVQDTDGWVLDPVPGKPAAEPVRALITLTTCQDLFHSQDRSVGFGHLVQTTDK